MFIGEKVGEEGCEFSLAHAGWKANVFQGRAVLSNHICGAARMILVPVSDEEANNIRDAHPPKILDRNRHVVGGRSDDKRIDDDPGAVRQSDDDAFSATWTEN